MTLQLHEDGVVLCDNGLCVAILSAKAIGQP